MEDSMKKILITIILFIGAIVVIWIAINQLNPSLDVIPEYSNGKVVTYVEAKNIQNITSTEFRYRTYFLDQYVNVEPRVDIYSFPNYKENHTYEICEELLQGKKDYIEVEVVITYDDGTHKMMGNAVIQNIKQKVYDDFVISPEVVDDRVYYVTDGLTAIISKDSFDEEIIFYSNTNIEYPNISVGFQKDYALYRLNTFGVISKTEALKRNFEGISPVDFTKDSGVDESYIVVEYSMIQLDWDGLYPYDLDGNKVFYENKLGEGGIDLFRNNKITEISQASYEKYRQMQNKIPNITFKISR
jgi:hypothetical protein